MWSSVTVLHVDSAIVTSEIIATSSVIFKISSYLGVVGRLHLGGSLESVASAKDKSGKVFPRGWNLEQALASGSSGGDQSAIG